MTSSPHAMPQPGPAPRHGAPVGLSPAEGPAGSQPAGSVSEILFPLLVALVLFAIPWGLGLWAVEQSHRQGIEAARQAVRADLREIAAHLQRISQPLTHVQDRLDRFVRALLFSRRAASVIGESILPFTQLFLFDARGRQIAMRGTTRGLTRATETALRLIRDSRVTGQSPRSLDERLVTPLFGDPKAIPALAMAPGRLLDLDFLGQRRFAGFFPVTDPRVRSRPQSTAPGGDLFVLAIVDRDRIPVYSLARENLDRFARRAGGAQSFGLTDLAGVEAPFFTPGYDLASAGARAVAPAGEGVAVPTPSGLDLGTPPSGGAPVRVPSFHQTLIASGETEVGGRLVIGTILARQFLVGVAMDIPRTVSWLDGHVWQVAGGTMAGLALLFLGLRWLIGRGTTLRVQVLLLVGLAGVGGIASVLGFADSYLETREAAIIRARRDAAEGMLTRIDMEFEGFRSRFVKQVRRLEARLARERTDAGFQRVLDGIAPRWRHWLSITLFDDEGRLRARNRSRVPSGIDQAFGREGLPLFGKIAKWAWRARDWRISHSQDFLPPEIERETPTVRFGTKDFVKFAGKIRAMQIGRFLLDRCNVFLQVPDGPRLALGVSLEYGVDKRAFLKGVHRRWRQTSFPTSFTFEVYGLHVTDLAISPHQKNLPKVREFLRLHDRLNLTRTTQEGKARFEGQDWLLVGRPGSRLEGFNLIMAIPLAPIQVDSQRLAGWFRLLSVIMLVFTLSLGSLFIDLVLAPLQQIFAGLENLAMSRFSERVKVVTGDEIEQVGNGINTLLEEMEQVLAAGKVHRQMIPRRPLRIPPLTATVAVRSPTQIGSDLADTCPAGGGALGFFLMSIPDRSIGSALVLAGAKAQVRVRFSGGHREPAEILRAVAGRFDPDAAVPADLLVGLADPETGGVELAWRGDFLVGHPGRPLLRLSPAPHSTIAGGGCRRVELVAGGSLLIATAGTFPGSRVPAEDLESRAVPMGSGPDPLLPSAIWTASPEQFPAILWAEFDRFPRKTVEHERPDGANGAASPGWPSAGENLHQSLIRVDRGPGGAV